MSNQRRIFYIAGPGNIIGTFGYWLDGQDDPSQVSMTYSGQFYDACQALDAKAYAVSSYPEQQRVDHERFTIEHRPIPLSNKSGIFYYLGQVSYELGLVFSALKFRADVVVGGSTACFFVWSLLRPFGVKLIPSLHCVLWPKYSDYSKVQKLIWKINGVFFRNACTAIMSISEDVNQQVFEVTGGKTVELRNFLATYRRIHFENILPPSQERSPFHVLFAGRIETNKGVFDLLEIAKRFQREQRNDIVFHICGTGSKLEELKQQAEVAGLSTSTFLLHGYCKKPEMHKLFNLCHVIVAPTTTDFIEGLNKVVVEGVLTNRPVITSSVCPALSYVKDAVVEVPPNDVAAYGDAIVRLYSDSSFYEEKQLACKALQEQFYLESNSWGGVFTSLVNNL